MTAAAACFVLWTSAAGAQGAPAGPPGPGQQPGAPAAPQPGQAAPAPGSGPTPAGPGNGTPPGNAPPPPPSRWYDPVVLDLNVGALTLKSGEVNLAGDLTLGYNTRAFGIVATGTGLDYQLDRANQTVDTLRGEVDAEAWYVTGEKSTWGRFEARLRFGGINNSSTIKTWAPGRSKDQPADGMHDETNWMWRPSLLLGLRLNGGPNFHFHLLAGGGFQYDWYDTTIVNQQSGVQMSDSQDLSAQGYGRAQLRWSFVPEWVSLRLKGELSQYSMSREKEEWNSTTNQFVSTKATASTLEIRSRASLELDVLQFLGISPFVYGSLDYFKQSIDSQTVSNTIPGFGAGLFKPID